MLAEEEYEDQDFKSTKSDSNNWVDILREKLEEKQIHIVSLESPNGRTR